MSQIYQDTTKTTTQSLWDILRQLLAIVKATAYVLQDAINLFFAWKLISIVFEIIITTGQENINLT